MSEKPVNLYDLLPSLYRIRDAEQGYKLRALLEIIEKQAGIVKLNIDNLWDDFFIETCSEWAIPYIGDLVGNNALYENAVRRRADVARTISYRRRKGTLGLIGEMAGDVSGWQAKASAMFQNMNCTQNLDHLKTARGAAPGTAYLKDLDLLERLGGPFDGMYHSADIRPLSRKEGWHNIRRIALFLWRLKSYPLTGSARRDASGKGYHFNPLGRAMPLFCRQEQGKIPGPIERDAFFLRPSDFYGPDKSLAIYRRKRASADDLVNQSEIVCMDLSEWQKPPENKVAVDPKLGRISFSEELTESDNIIVYYNFGFSSDMGGGPYLKKENDDRSQWDAEWTAYVSRIEASENASQRKFSSLGDALNAWTKLKEGEEKRPHAQIIIQDSSTYFESITVKLAEGERLSIKAENGQRPLLSISDEKGDILIAGGSGQHSLLALEGLLIEGGIRIESNSLGNLEIVHCTLVPGRKLNETGLPDRNYSLNVESPEKGGAGIEILIDHSIAGCIIMPSDTGELTIRDCIIDSVPGSGKAQVVSALVSGLLKEPLEFLQDNEEIFLSIGSIGPIEVALKEMPKSLDKIADALQAAIRSAHSSRGFSSVHVLAAESRLAILSDSGSIFIDSSPLARELKLDSASSNKTYALLSGFINVDSLSQSSPSIKLLAGSDGFREVSLEGGSIDAAIIRMQEILKSEQTSVKAFEPIVARLGQRLMVIAAEMKQDLMFSETSKDRISCKELSLEFDLPAIAGSYSGISPGPKTNIKRSTLFGSVHLKELALASDCIFTKPAIIDRHHAGCIRFSYLPPGSETPARYHCQPDTTRDEIIAPSFSSISYDRPGYAQLCRSCPDGIWKGAEDGSEMGAFCELKQPEREANLRIRLDEYLPFGLDVGFVYVT